MFFKGLSVAIVVLSIAWLFVQRNDSPSMWPMMMLAFGLGMGIGAF